MTVMYYTVTSSRPFFKGVLSNQYSAGSFGNGTFCHFAKAFSTSKVIASFAVQSLGV